MDGNGRWAAKRALPRTAGHKQGTETVRRVVEAAAEQGISILTLFGFSSENWSRPESEISDLMKLLRYYLRSETAELHKKGARLRVIGDRSAFAPDIVELIENAEHLTAQNTKITLVIALNYGGRNDILKAAQGYALAAIDKFEQTGERPDMLDAQADFPSHLMTQGLPDPDLLIRTSGEQRISNFLLWQSAYTELVFSDVLWPDFDAAALQSALEIYATRDRRFGGVKASQR